MIRKNDKPKDEKNNFNDQLKDGLRDLRVLYG